MKKLLTLGVALLMLVNLCSCCCAPLTKKNKKAEADEVVTTTEPMETTTTTQAEETGITFDSYTLTVNAGAARQIIASAPEDAILQWTSSNEQVVLVNSQGMVTGVSAGVANVICTDGESQAICTVTVVASGTTGTTIPVVTDGSYIFPHSSTTYLTEWEIEATLGSYMGGSPTGNYAQDAINEIYARNGYVFQDKSLRAYYEAKSWYQADSSFTTGALNKYEKANIELLKKYK